MGTTIKVILGIAGAALAYGIYQSYKEKKLWYAGPVGDTTSLQTEPGREQIDIPPGAINEPWGGYTPPAMDL